ncbi:MerR family transcriptional regulator [Levilactobacillus namurensis]|uniref:MerR family transcriptional regulator n=1 Tax=Levilactobacillus namurensis TaxID=380393 RepID=UPI001D3D10C9|nr:MerR family transcriptional regulator [Levilactobacillus namurensis]HJE44592.1 MerR family transcriptional regulator [Levilactobacillus namurensis]
MQIKAAATASGVSAYTIRFYEKKGLLTIPRNANGVREFDQDALNRLRWIQCYRQAGLSLKEINQIITGDLTQAGYLDLLDAAKHRLEAQIDDLRHTEACLETKRHATLDGERLTDMTTCAPTPYVVKNAEA